MKNNIVLKQKQQCYFANNKVEIIKIYNVVNLAKIKFLNTEVCTTVDLNALTLYPDLTQRISFKLLGGQ